MDIILYFVFVAIGFGLLIKAADFLVEGSAALAVKFSISEIAIGLTIVSFGTSAPELVVNVIASFQNNPEITMGNVIGSNIINTLLILGVAAAIYPIHTEKNTVWREIPFSLLAVIVLFVACNDNLFDGGTDVLSRVEGLLFLLFFIIFLAYSFAISGIESQDIQEIKTLSNRRITVYILVGIVGLFFGGKLVVDNAVNISEYFHISEKVIGLTIVAIGTSLPELVTSAVAAYKHKSDIAIGNVVGSNIFNIFFVLAISTIIRPIDYLPELNFDLAILVAASLLLFLTMFTGKKRSLDRREAIILLLMYLVYTIYILIRG